jgi:hypothetical protein
LSRIASIDPLLVMTLFHDYDVIVLTEPRFEIGDGTD